MDGFLNVDNPDEKIKNFLQRVINKKNSDGQEYMARLNSQLEDLKKQQETGVILSQNEETPVLNARVILGTIVSILGDILYGFGEAAKQVKENAMKTNTQSGGADEMNDKTTDINNPQSVARDELVKRADKVGTLMRKVKTDISTTADLAKDSFSDINVNDLLFDVYSETSRLGLTALKTGFMWSEEFINRMIDLALDASGEGNIASTPWNKLSPDLNKKLLLFATILKELSDNPATKEAVREIAESVAVSLVDLLEELQPEVNKITDQVINMLKEIASKSVRGATSTGLSIAQAFLAEIPFVGGILDLTIAIGKGFNALLATYKIFVTRSAQVGVQGIQTMVNSENTAMQGVNRVKSTVNNVTNRFENTVNKPSSVPSSVPSTIQSGGKSMTKYTRGGITKCERRLRKTLKLFNTTLSKQPFTTRNKSFQLQRKSKKNNYTHKRQSKKRR